MAPKEIRPIRVEGNVAYVPLTQGYEAVIDAEDVPLVDKWNWRAMVTPHTVYVRRGIWSNGKSTTILLHRAIMGDPSGLEVDHRDGNGLNNCRANLRLATTAQNQHNQRLARHNTSGFKGVSWNRRANKWVARIRVHGKQRTLGSFTTPEAAHSAYSEASRALHGEFGRTT